MLVERSTAATLIMLFAAFVIPVRPPAQAQENESSMISSTAPVPLINQPLVPDAIRPGAAGFTLTVNGTGFVLGSVVKWNGNARATAFVNSSRLKASILGSDVAKAGTASVTVANPTPGGGTSNRAFFEISTLISSLTMSTSNFRTGAGTNSIVVGDFNGDGKFDLAVANIADNTISILLGNGDGTFRPAVNYRAGSGFETYAVTVGDFNGDGKQDLAVTDDSGPTGAGTVGIFLGNGDGTFQPAVSYRVGANPSSVVVGDFNRDGKLDLAVANFNSNNVSVLLGNGDGTFRSSVTYGTLPSPMGLTVGDFNRDGKLDLVVANSAENGGTPGIGVLLGNGDGSFQPAVNYSTGSFPTSIAAGDFNGDGKLDIAVANLSSSTVSIFLGNGDGTFRPAVNYSAGLRPQGLAVADFNGDNKLDLAVAYNDGTVSIVLGNGDGTFRAAANYPAASIPVSLAVGDFNGDGRLDMAVADYDGSSAASVSVLLQATVVSLSTTGLKFADQVLGSNSPTQKITITNTGQLALKVASLSITGKDATDFSQANNCGTGVVSGASCTISVTFKPTQVGPRSASVTITDNALSSPQSVTLNGTGVTSGPNVTLSRTSISFSTQLVGTGSTAQSFTVTNYGLTTLTISNIAITGTNAADFSQAHSCGGSLATGASCTITVTFRPTGSGTRTAAVSITDNASGSPQKVALSGVGTIGKLSPISLSFGSVVIDTTSSAQTGTLTNVGTTTLTITGIAITGTNAGDFAQTHTCGSLLSAGASCSISVTFRPTASGTRTAVLSISDNGGGSPQAVSLSGSGVSGRCTPYGGECGTPFTPRCCAGLTCSYCGLRNCCL